MAAGALSTLRLIGPGQVIAAPGFFPPFFQGGLNLPSPVLQACIYVHLIMKVPLARRYYCFGSQREAASL